MLIIIISRSSLKLDHVGSKTRLLGHQATQVSDLGPLWPSCFLFQESGTQLFGGCGDNNVYAWDIETGQETVCIFYIFI